MTPDPPRWIIRLRLWLLLLIIHNETPPNDGHRLNLLNCSLKDVGVGYAANSNST
jgi:hypothetical protein